jgi:hypothetical protein
MKAGRSKTAATWIALFGGCLGLHRFYLHGWKDAWGWLHVPLALLGAYGVWRMLSLGQDDRLAWVLIPWLGLVISASMMASIVYGLTPDEKWNARFDPAAPPRRSGWLAVLGVITALTVGSTVLIATIAFSGQRYFEAQAEEGQAIGR